MDKSKKKKIAIIIIVITIIIAESFFRNSQVDKETEMASLDLVINAIDEAIATLSENPNQFSFSINVTGTSITSHGGTGLNVTATGGGPGSNTIGFQSSVAGSQIQIAQNAVDQHLQAEADKAIKVLQELRDTLHNQEYDKDKAKTLLQKLKETYLPSVVSSIIAKLVMSYMGI